MYACKGRCCVVGPDGNAGGGGGWGGDGHGRNGVKGHVEEFIEG